MTTPVEILFFGYTKKIIILHDTAPAQAIVEKAIEQAWGDYFTCIKQNSWKSDVKTLTVVPVVVTMNAFLVWLFCSTVSCNIIFAVIMQHT